jgi:hypothetical protein
VCPGEPSNVFVGVTIIDDEQERPKRCVWSHPPASPGELVTTYRDVPLGTVIRGHAGMGWLTERDRAGPAFVVRVVISGTEIGRLVHQDGEGWKPFEFPLGSNASRRADVEFRVSSAGAGNNACFEADSR